MSLRCCNPCGQMNTATPAGRTSSRCSKTRTSRPCFCSASAVANPPGPPPTMATSHVDMAVDDSAKTAVAMFFLPARLELNHTTVFCPTPREAARHPDSRRTFVSKHRALAPCGATQTVPTHAMRVEVRCDDHRCSYHVSEKKSEEIVFCDDFAERRRVRHARVMISYQNNLRLFKIQSLTCA